MPEDSYAFPAALEAWRFWQKLGDISGCRFEIGDKAWGELCRGFGRLYPGGVSNHLLGLPVVLLPHGVDPWRVEIIR